MNWKNVKLQDICLKIQDGAHHSPKNLYPLGGEGRFLYITSKNIRNNYIDLRNISYVDSSFHESIYPRCNPELGDVLLTKDGVNTGNVAINTINEPFSLLSSVCLIKTDSKKLMPNFLVYYIQSKLGFEQITGNMTGAAIKRIILRTIKNCVIPLPPLDEQKRIVAILDEAFEGIDRAIANTEKNLANARELFESYLNGVFTRKGEGWVETKLERVSSKIGSGATPKGGQNSYKTEGISLIRSLNVHDRKFKKKNLAFIDDEQAEKLSNVVVEEGDVLLNITGASIARSCVVPNKYLPARVNQHVAIIRPETNKILPKFLNYLLTSKSYKTNLLFTGDKAGATRQALTKAQIQKFSICFPGLQEQKIIVEKLDLFSEETQRLEAIYTRKLEALKELKQSILEKAFTGELTSDMAKEVADTKETAA